MTTINVRPHTRRLPDKDRLKDLAFREEIEARKQALERKLKPRRQWRKSGIHWPSFWRGFRDVWASPYALAAIIITASIVVGYAVQSGP